MIKAYSQRLSPPFSGQVQVVESTEARAISMDGQSWEFQQFRGTPTLRMQGYQKHQRNYARLAYVGPKWIQRAAEQGHIEGESINPLILELVQYIVQATLPFPVADLHEYWLLDAADQSPLALIFSCLSSTQTQDFPDYPEWIALPAAVMPIQKTQDEVDCGTPPANYQIERLVAERAGTRPQARWFRRSANEADQFPPLLLREDWQDDAAERICQRYLDRQSTRLLMLHNMPHAHRLRLEQAAKEHVLEVERYHTVYPEVADPDLMKAMRVEAKLRNINKQPQKPKVHQRRDSILYI